MSVQPELTDPRISAFLASDPNLRSPVLAAPAPPPPKDDSHLTEIAIGISAAFIAWRMIVRHRLQQEHPRSEAEAKHVTLRAIKSLSKAWEALSLPPVKQAYSVVPYKAVQTLAIDYATELGQYVNDTSVDALLEGFSSQINAGVGEGLAWDRAVNGYGLDPRQMKTYISNLLVAEKPRYGEPAIPPRVQASLDRAVLVRADRLGMNESFKAVQVGKNMTWMAMQAGGDLPEGTKKKWVTADDERVCEVCGPLDQKTIPLHWRFKANNGEKFYAPGVHPRCRCEMELVYPSQQFDDIVKALGEDEFDRDVKGRFAVNEERAQLGGAKFAAQSRTGAKFSEKKTKWARNNARIGVYPGAKFDVGVADFGRRGARFAGQYRDIADDLEDAIDPPEEEEADWHTDTVAYVPATRFYQAVFNQQNKLWTPSVLTSATMNGTPITLNAKRKLRGEVVQGLRGHLTEDPRPYLYENDAFLDAFVYDARDAAKDAIEANKAADAPGGGRAVESRIAPYATNVNLNEYRKALAGLNRRQLLYLMNTALWAPDATAETLGYVRPSEDVVGREDIIDFWDSKDVNEIATEMLLAYEDEDYDRSEGAVDTPSHAWEDALAHALKAHKEGWLAKRLAFREVGEGDFRTSRAVVFRIANGWHGTPSYENKNRDDTANVDGRYVVAAVHHVKAPSSSALGAGYPIGLPERLTTDVILIDLVPQHVGVRDKNGKVIAHNLFLPF